MEKIFTTIIDELKAMEVGTMIYAFLISIILFLLDFFYLRFHIQHTIIVDVFRSIYFILGLFSNIFLFDRIYKAIRNYFEQVKINKAKAEEYQRTVYNLAIPVKQAISKLSEQHTDLLKEFVYKNTLEISSLNEPNGYNENIQIANEINALLFGFSLNIDIHSTFTHIFLDINMLYLDVLKVIFLDLAG